MISVKEAEEVHKTLIENFGGSHGISDDRESLLTDRIVRHQIVGAIVPDPADRIVRHKAVDVDRMGALQSDGVEFLVLKRHILVGAGLIPLDLVILLDWSPRLSIDIAALDAISGGPVQHVEADSFTFSDRRHHGHRTGHQGKLQIALPEGMWRHGDVILCDHGVNPRHREAFPSVVSRVVV